MDYEFDRSLLRPVGHISFSKVLEGFPTGSLICTGIPYFQGEARTWGEALD